MIGSNEGRTTPGMSNLFISPHNDDETLFGAFTLCREAADIQVVVMFDGYVQATRGEPVTWEERRAETVAALKELGVVKPPIFAAFGDDAINWNHVHNYVRCFSRSLQPSDIAYIPLCEYNGHEQHNRLSEICTTHFNAQAEVRIQQYTTYTTMGRSIGSIRIHPQPDWVIRKLRALACYKSQITVENCREHFMRGLHEYYA